MFSIRSMGAAALGLAYVAIGVQDLYQVEGLYPWDAAAGAVLVQEAGGYICTTRGMITCVTQLVYMFILSVILQVKNSML